MNVSSCPGCGDTHWCAGSNTRLTAEAGPTLMDQITRFVADTFVPDPTGVVPTSEAWAAYLDWCAANQETAFSQRRFVGAVGALRIRRVKRSTMRFTGITWKRSQIRGRHAAPDVTPAVVAR